MKTIIVTVLIIFSTVCINGQVGINISQPNATLDIHSPTNPTSAVGIIAPSITGDNLKTQDAAYTANQKGAFVYVSQKVTTPSAKTAAVNVPGYYYFDGTIWNPLKAVASATDASRYIGGAVYVRFDSTANSVNADTYIPNNRIITNNTNGQYAVGSLQVQATRGGIDSITGTGYKISNPANGIFDIQFETPFTEIYGFSSNILDAYGNSGGSIPNGGYPDSRFPGTRLLTNDNTQLTFISNTIIRIKTGNSNGGLSNRPFTFVVTGR